MAIPPLRAIDELVDGPRRQPNLKAADTAPTVSLVDASTGSVAGGLTVTITGTNFRTLGDGTVPTVTFDGEPATDVTVVSSTQLTCTTPAVPDTGPVDVTVTIESQAGTLAGGFTYFTVQILAVNPAFGPLAGGTIVTITGVNFPADSVPYFGDDEAPDFIRVDSQHIVATTPPHAIGFVTVSIRTPRTLFSSTIFSPAIFAMPTLAQTTYASLTGAFQYTLLTRGEDIRRESPSSISIRENLNNSPNECTFAVDGESNAPQVAEKIQITDEEDENRLLFAGTVISIDQEYEGQIDQLVWKVRAVDFTWLANRKRPFGVYVVTSVSDIVKDLVAKYAPGFTSNHVQTNLAKVTAVFDGTKDLSTCLSDLAKAIGGGHWRWDYQQDLHFFHVQPDPKNLLPPTQTPDPTSYIDLTEGGSIQSTFTFDPGYYWLAHTFLYSNGAESTLQSISNVVRFAGTKQFSLASIPLGANLSADVTCVGRRIYYKGLTGTIIGSLQSQFDQLRPFCQINDNTTTAFTCDFGSQGASSSAVSDITSALPGHDAPTTAPTFALGAAWTPGSSHTPLNGAKMAYTFVFDDGVESLPSPFSDALTGDDGHFGWTATVPVGGASVVKRRVYFTQATARPDLYEIWNPYYLEIDDNTTTAIANLSIAGNTLYTDVAVFLQKPVGTPGYGRGTPPVVDVALPAAFNTTHPVGPTTAPAITANTMSGRVSSYNPNGTPSYGTTVTKRQYRVSYLYRDGTESFAGPASNTAGDNFAVNGYETIGFNVRGIPIGPSINGNDVVARFLYWDNGDMQNPNTQNYYPGVPPLGYVWPNTFVLDPTWADGGGGIVCVPDNATIDVNNIATWASFGSVYTPPTGQFPDQQGLGVGRMKPVLNANEQALSTDPIPVWPNPDGPSLEDDDPPGDIDDANEDLLHGESGSQPFTRSVDISQIRNRVMVFGSGSILTVDALAGDTQIVVNDITAFSPAGGTVRIVDQNSGNVLQVNYNSVGGVTGNAYVVLSQALSARVPQGSVIVNYFMAEDVESQKTLSKIELDVNGRPTDGIHEYVISDSSLKARFQIYMRAFAELELFAWPIVTIRYATRDSKTHPGQTVHVDLNDPPCSGDFLIQSVTIDQIRDAGEQLAPRYTAEATSTRYTLDDLLLALIGNTVSGSAPSTAGIAAAGVEQTVNSSGGTGVPLQGTRVSAWSWADAFNAGDTIHDVNWVSSKQGTIDDHTGVLDGFGSWEKIRTAAAAGSTDARSFANATGWTYVDWLPLLDMIVRPNTIASVRFWLGMSGNALFADTDTPQESHGTLALRYSTNAGDPAFRPVVTYDPSHTTPGNRVIEYGALLSNCPIISNNIYRIRLNVTPTPNSSTTLDATWQVNDLTTGNYATSVQTFNQANFSQYKLIPCIFVSALVATAKSIEWSKVYAEHN